MLVVDWIVCKSKHGESNNNNSWFSWICNRLNEKQDEYKYELIGDGIISQDYNGNYSSDARGIINYTHYLTAFAKPNSIFGQSFQSRSNM